jgi:hypothetical protein
MEDTMPFKVVKFSSAGPSGSLLAPSPSVRTSIATHRAFQIRRIFAKNLQNGQGEFPHFLDLFFFFLIYKRIFTSKSVSPPQIISKYH